MERSKGKNVTARREPGGTSPGGDWVEPNKPACVRD